MPEIIVIEIPRSQDLDMVTVIMQDFGEHRGRLIVECYGEVWGAYWGAMPEETIKALAIIYLRNQTPGAQND